MILSAFVQQPGQKIPEALKVAALLCVQPLPLCLQDSRVDSCIAFLQAEDCEDPPRCAYKVPDGTRRLPNFAWGAFSLPTGGPECAHAGTPSLHGLPELWLHLRWCGGDLGQNIPRQTLTARLLQEIRGQPKN